jgi:hypothetical protein
MGDRINNHIFTDLRLTRRPIGTVLVDGGFITCAELDRALDEQHKTGEPLGEILIRMGLLGTEDLLAVLSAQGRLASLGDALRAVSGPDRTLGELLLICGRITTKTLEAALEEQKLTGRKLGETLAGMGLISTCEIDAALAFQQNIRKKKPKGSGFRLGELLVATNLITDEQLSDALARQRLNKKRLGEVLIEAGYAKEDHVNYGLKLQHRLLTATLVALLSYAVTHDADAADLPKASNVSADSTVSVTATVKPFARIKVLKQPGEVVITHTDILRGYVDVNTASEFDVKNNSLAGYLLVFEYSGAAFSEVRVRGLGTDVVFTSGTAWVAQPNSGAPHDLIELSYRFRLSKNVAPGTYMWPINTSVEPL